MAKKLVLIIDGCNLLHQSFHKFEKLKSTDGKPSGAIFGFFRSLHGFLHRWDPDEVIITFDNGHIEMLCYPIIRAIGKISQ